MEIPPNSSLSEYFDANPFAYVPYRIMNTYADAEVESLPVRKEVPMVSSILFTVALLGYVLLNRFRYLVRSGFASSIDSGGHLFTMTSTKQFRRHSFTEVASELNEDADVVLLCSPATVKYTDEWNERGLRTVTFQDLLRHISIWNSILAVPKTAATLYQLYSIVDRPVTRFPNVLLWNLTYLEYIKRESIRDLTENNPAIHTYSPMPYLVTSTESDRLYVYQHGVKWPTEGEDDSVLWAVPFFAPMVYFIWSDLWHRVYERYAHPESEIVAVGSPWHDYLAERRRDHPARHKWDVLFISNEYNKTDPNKQRAFRTLVSEIVSRCERNGWSLAIKLHPLEQGGRYEDWGLSNYVVEFEDIDDAILQSKIAITNSSSAFVECVALGTPVIVADVFEYGLRDLGPVKDVTFPKVGEAADALERLVNSYPPESNDKQRAGAANRMNDAELVKLGGSVDRVTNFVEER